MLFSGFLSGQMVSAGSNENQPEVSMRKGVYAGCRKVEFHTFHLDL